MEMYSPTAMDRAPATRPAMPARTIVRSSSLWRERERGEGGEVGWPGGARGRVAKNNQFFSPVRTSHPPRPASGWPSTRGHRWHPARPPVARAPGARSARARRPTLRRRRPWRRQRRPPRAGPPLRGAALPRRRGGCAGRRHRHRHRRGRAHERGGASGTGAGSCGGRPAGWARWSGHAFCVLERVDWPETVMVNGEVSLFFFHREEGPLPHAQHTRRCGRPPNKEGYTHARHRDGTYARLLPQCFCGNICQTRENCRRRLQVSPSSCT